MLGLRQSNQFGHRASESAWVAWFVPQFINLDSTFVPRDERSHEIFPVLDISNSAGANSGTIGIIGNTTRRVGSGPRGNPLASVSKRHIVSVGCRHDGIELCPIESSFGSLHIRPRRSRCLSYGTDRDGRPNARIMKVHSEKGGRNRV